MKLLELAELVHLWDRDEDDFRKRLRKDAKATIESYGYEVTAEEEQVINTTDWTLGDEELEVVLTHRP